MSLSKLTKHPPEVLSSVINNEAIPLGRRLHLRLLCNRWADIIEDALKIETSLVLRDEGHAFNSINDLVIPSTDLTDEFIRPLSRIFTSLTQLTLSFEVKASWSKIPALLAHLDSSNLTALKLYGRMLDSEPTDAIAIADALNALSGVTSLSIGGGSLLSHLGPVISRLEKFTCFDNLCKHISSFAPTRLTHLGLTAYVFQSFPSPFLLELSRNLTHLHLLDCDNTIWQSISQMHALSSLTLRFTRYVGFCPFTDNGADLDSSFFRHLTHLTNLTHVELYRLKYGTPLALPSKKQTPLSSIKRLTLEVHFGDFAFDYHAVDYQSFFGGLSAWFPSLACLTLFTEPYTFPAIRASLGELAFSVVLADCQIVDPWR